MAHCCTAAIGTFGRAVLCCARERRKEMNVTHKLIAVPVSPAAHVTLQRLERRLLDAVAVDRPPDDLLGVGKDLAGMEMGLFGLGDGVASGKTLSSAIGWGWRCGRRGYGRTSGGGGGDVEKRGEDREDGVVRYLQGPLLTSTSGGPHGHWHGLFLPRRRRRRRRKLYP